LGLHFEITSFGNRPHNFVAEYIDVNTFKHYQTVREFYMISGLQHVAIGVSDIDRSLLFYREILGFKNVLLDVTYRDLTMGQVIGRSVGVRIIMLENDLGGGAIKLVKLLPHHEDHMGHKSRLISSGRRWGDAGHLEVAVEVSDVERTYAEFKKKRLEFALSPQHWHIPDKLGATYFYLRDPDGVLVEVIDGPRKKEFADFSGVFALNHTAIGVTNMKRSLAFYSGILGFEVLIDVEGTWPGEEVIVGESIEQRIVMLGSPNGGARIELIEILFPNQSKPIPPEKRWGDIGVMEAALEVKDIDKVYKKLSDQGVQFLCPISNIPETPIRYVFIRDPDDSEIGLYEIP
jgi:catechol 2,3-dioxygenase-like lactoylglutathione lyase family enzyme